MRPSSPSAPALPAELRARLEALYARAGARARAVQEAQGACRVYAHRPLACRTYGFFADREGLQACHLVLAYLERGGEQGVVWGNAAPVERELGALGGEAHPLSVWLERLAHTPG